MKEPKSEAAARHPVHEQPQHERRHARHASILRFTHCDVWYNERSWKNGADTGGVGLWRRI